MGPAIGRFLKAVSRLAKNGDITIDEVYDFAKKEFGEVSDLLKLQINKIFKQSDAPSIRKPEGEVIEASFKPGRDKTGKVVEESESQKLGLAGLNNPYRPGGGLDKVTGITRALARRILDRRGIEIGKKDPIDAFSDTFGESITDVKNLAEEMIEIEARGGGMKNMDEMLEIEGLFDIPVPKNPSKGLTDKELLEKMEETEAEDILKKFDPEDREPNAKGGRVGYEEGGIGSLPAGLRIDTTTGEGANIFDMYAEKDNDNTFNMYAERPDAPNMAADEIAKVIMGTLGIEGDTSSRTFIFENYVMPKRKQLMENYGLTLQEADDLIREGMAKYRTEKAGGGLSYLSGF